MGSPATVPLSFDAQGNPIQPSRQPMSFDAQGKPLSAAPSSSGWSIGSVLSGTDPLHQEIDKAAQTEPEDTSSVGAFAKSTLNNIGAGAVRIFNPLVHPLNTLGATAQMMRAAMGDTGAMNDFASNMVRPFVQNPGGEAVAQIPQLALMGAGAGEAPNVAKAIDAGPAEGGIAQAAISASQKAGAKYLPALVDGPPESLLTRAVKPGKNNVGWNTDIQKAIPLMKSAEQDLGRPVAGIDDALEAANIAKKNIWQQYQARLSAGGQMGATIDGNQIADAMMGSIDKRTALQNPGLVQRVQSVADTYRRPLPLNEAEDFLQSANKDLNTYYAKNKVGQRVALNDSETASTEAEASALRDSLYSRLDQVAGPGAAQLKQAYGAISNVQKELYGRQLVAARQQAESLAQQLSTARGVGTIAKGIVTLPFRPLGAAGDIAEGTQNIAISQALKERNSPDAMIARAFQAAQPAQPFPAPSLPRFAGLLQRGPIQMPGAPEPGGTPAGYQPPPIDATTLPQRMGRLLPAQSGAPHILPYYPEMTAGERAAAFMQYLRQKQQLQLPANSVPRQFPPPQ